MCPGEGPMVKTGQNLDEEHVGDTSLLKGHDEGSFSWPGVVSVTASMMDMSGTFFCPVSNRIHS